jgi:predicted RNA binding protein YcfA (HicA-like mRNA interferase family)
MRLSFFLQFGHYPHVIGIQSMPKKIRELIQALKSAGFTEYSGKGSHRKFKHPALPGFLTLSGNPGADAHSYQEKMIIRAIREANNAKK